MSKVELHYASTLILFCSVKMVLQRIITVLLLVLELPTILIYSNKMFASTSTAALEEFHTDVCTYSSKAVFMHDKQNDN